MKLNEITKLFDKGYKANEINSIYNDFYSNKDFILKCDYIKDLLKFKDFSYFKNDRLSRYLSYRKKHNNLSLENVITYVNMNLDYDFYTHTIYPKDPSNYNTMVNKYYSLGKYRPNDLELVSREFQQPVPVIT